MKKLFINAPRTFATGAVQVSVSFIQECVNFKDFEYYVFISGMIAKQFDITKFPSNFHFEVFENFPKQSLKYFKLQLYLKKREKELLPDCVFTIFGPTIWKPKSKHLVGYAYPYYIYPESPFFKIIDWQFWLKIKFNSVLFKHLFNKNSDYFVSETEDATNRLMKFLNNKKNRYYTVTNTCNTFFIDKKLNDECELLPLKGDNEFRFVTLSTFAKHKNLQILNSVIPILRKRSPEIDWRFVLTVDNDLFVNNINEDVRPYIYNLGRIKVEQCPQAYYECDAMFLPTLLECFSASYAEAMYMKKPILTSDLSFARSICQDAALYFNPIDSSSIVSTIIQLKSNKKLQEKLIINGDLQLSKFDSATTRAQKYLEICKKISS
jgi:glycosyltransferase involved in cell wall biosynthesis